MSQSLSAKDLMQPRMMTVNEDMTIDDLGRFLVENRVTGAPVVNDDGRLVGVVSSTDLARAVVDSADDDEAAKSAYYRDDDRAVTLEDLGQRYVEQRALTVRELMNPVIHHVPETATIAEVAAVMVDRRIHRVLVTRDGNPVGIIASMDVLRVMADGKPQDGRTQ